MTLLLMWLLSFQLTICRSTWQCVSPSPIAMASCRQRYRPRLITSPSTPLPRKTVLSPSPAPTLWHKSMKNTGKLIGPWKCSTPGKKTLVSWMEAIVSFIVYTMYDVVQILGAINFIIEAFHKKIEAYSYYFFLSWNCSAIHLRIQEVYSLSFLEVIQLSVEIF